MLMCGDRDPWGAFAPEPQRCLSCKPPGKTEGCWSDPANLPWGRGAAPGGVARGELPPCSPASPGRILPLCAIYIIRASGRCHRMFTGMPCSDAPVAGRILRPVKIGNRGTLVPSGVRGSVLRGGGGTIQGTERSRTRPAREPQWRAKPGVTSPATAAGGASLPQASL